MSSRSLFSFPAKQLGKHTFNTGTTGRTQPKAEKRKNQKLEELGKKRKLKNEEMEKKVGGKKPTTTAKLDYDGDDLR